MSGIISIHSFYVCKMCSMMGAALCFALFLAMWQGQTMHDILTTNVDNAENIIRHADVEALRAFLENHKHDFAVCFMCTDRMTEEMCNHSVSFLRKDLCLDIIRHCQTTCQFLAS